MDIVFSFHSQKQKIHFKFPLYRSYTNWKEISEVYQTSLAFFIKAQLKAG